MDKETLEKAKLLENDIEQMKAAIALYRKGDHQDADDDYFHFEYCKGSCGLFAEREELPARLNQRLMAVVEEELHRTEEEMKALGSWDPSAADLPRTHGEWQPSPTYTEGDRVTMGGVEYVFRDGKFVKACRRSRPKPWVSMIPFVITVLDITAMSIVCVRHWDSVSRFFTDLAVLNAAAVIGTVSLLMEIEGFFGLEKRRQKNDK